jgi:hypothetical protein
MCGIHVALVSDVEGEVQEAQSVDATMARN